MHSEGILAGELKHGPLALIDKQMPIIMVIMKDPCFAKCQNALQQITARQVRALRGLGHLAPSLFQTCPPQPPPASTSYAWVLPVSRGDLRVSPLMSGTHIQKGTGQLSTMPRAAP